MCQRWAEYLKNAAVMDRGSDRGRRAVGEPLARGFGEGARLVLVTPSWSQPRSLPGLTHSLCSEHRAPVQHWAARARVGVVSPRSRVTKMITLVWDFAPKWLVLVLSNSCFDGKNNH